MERRRDPHAASSALNRPPRAAAGSFAADMAGPGMAGAAGRDAADRRPRRDAAHRHARHRLALASRHRPSPLDAPVAPWSLRAAAGAPQCAVGGAPAGPGERVMGIPPHSRRTGRARHHGSGVDGMADPEERGDRPGAAPRRAATGRAGRSSCDHRHRESWRWTSSPPISSPARRSTSWPQSSMAPATFGSSVPPSTRVQTWIVQQQA